MAVSLDLTEHPGIVHELGGCFSGLLWLHYRTTLGITADDFMRREWKCWHIVEGMLMFDSDADMVEFVLRSPWNDVPWKQSSYH